MCLICQGFTQSRSAVCSHLQREGAGGACWTFAGRGSWCQSLMASCPTHVTQSSWQVKVPGRQLSFTILRDMVYHRYSGRSCQAIAHVSLAFVIMRQASCSATVISLWVQSRRTASRPSPPSGANTRKSKKNIKNTSVMGQMVLNHFRSIVSHYQSPYFAAPSEVLGEIPGTELGQSVRTSVATASSLPRALPRGTLASTRHAIGCVREDAWFDDDLSDWQPSSCAAGSSQSSGAVVDTSKMTVFRVTHSQPNRLKRILG